jgi:hypothetical protein
MTENRRRAIFSTDSAPFNTLLIEVADVKRPDQKDASKSSGSTGPVFRLRAQRRNDVSQEDGCFLIPADFELEQLVRQEEWRFRSLHLTRFWDHRSKVAGHIQRHDLATKTAVAIGA